MNSHKQDKNQRQRMVQSLYRKKKRKNVNRVDENKTWTVFIVISVLFALFILITTELAFIDRGEPIPEVLSKFLTKLAATFNLIFL